ncbi:MAG: class F sortase [Nocardioides sp.]
MRVAPRQLTSALVLALVATLLGSVLAAAGPSGTAVAAPESGSAERRSTCGSPDKPFRPVSISVSNIVSRAPVLALGRDRNRVPKSPPTSDKRSFAWDKKGRKPGSQTAVVKMNTHTYPDGSATGNRLLANLHVGDVIALHGPRGEMLCYDVVDRTQVRANKRVRSYYRRQGPPRLGIVVCSGVRRGPGDWSHRTIWYAAPRMPLDSAEPFN